MSRRRAVVVLSGGGAKGAAHIGAARALAEHDIEVVHDEPGAAGLPAVVRYIHAAGPAARITLEQVQSHEAVEVEISRTELAVLGLKTDDLVRLRLRQGHSFPEDYTI